MSRNQAAQVELPKQPEEGRTTMPGRNRTAGRGRGAAGLIAGALVVGFLGTASSAQAVGEPVIFCAQAFGHAVPSTYCDPNPNVLVGSPTMTGKTYPNSYLYITSQGTSGWAYPRKGHFYVEGNATPGAAVEISITDGLITRGPWTVLASTASAGSDQRPGDFRLDVPTADNAALGGHRATPDFDADNVGDDELGPTVLTISMTPRVGASVGATATTTLTKHAAVAGDVSKPQITNTKFPPSPWGRNTCPLNCAHTTIEGRIQEDGPTAGNRFSEISDVRIQIKKGTVSYLDVRDSEEGALARSRGLGGILTRDSTNYANYRWQMTSHQLPPNNLALIGMDTGYIVTVTVCDAWGSVLAPQATPNNCTVVTSGSITVTSF